MPGESATGLQADGVEPELGRRTASFDVDMHRFRPVARIEEEPKATYSQDCRHRTSWSRFGLRPPRRFANFGRGLPGGPSQSQGGGVEASRLETPRSYALALGPSLNAREPRAPFFHPRSIGRWENSAHSHAARAV